MLYEVRTHNVQIILNDFLGICEINNQLRPDYWCIKGWTSSVQKLRLKADVVFFGNSITSASDFQEYFKDKTIVELGYPGDRLDGMNRRIEMVQSLNPEKIFVMGGINDLHRSSPQIVAERMKLLIESLQDSLPNARIYIQSILPVNNLMERKYANNQIIRETNALIEACAKVHKCVYIDLNSIYLENGFLPDSLTTDGVHLKKEAYDRWANAIQPYIYE